MAKGRGSNISSVKVDKKWLYEPVQSAATHLKHERISVHMGEGYAQLHVGALADCQICGWLYR